MCYLLLLVYSILPTQHQVIPVPKHGDVVHLGAVEGERPPCRLPELRLGDFHQLLQRIRKADELPSSMVPILVISAIAGKVIVDDHSWFQLSALQHVAWSGLFVLLGAKPCCILGPNDLGGAVVQLLLKNGAALKLILRK